MPDKKMIPIIKERLQDILNNDRITQKELCEAIYISPEHFSRCLKKGEVTSATMKLICDYLDISPEYLSGSIDSTVNIYGYTRSNAIKQEKEILEKLFILVGWTKEELDHMEDWEISNLVVDLNNLCSAHILNSKYEQSQQKDNNLPF